MAGAGPETFPLGSEGRFRVDTVMQRENEHGRIAVDGWRTDDGERCTLVVVAEVGRTWAFYPHGWGKFGVRLTDQEARRVAQRILDGAR